MDLTTCSFYLHLCHKPQEFKSEQLTVNRNNVATTEAICVSGRQVKIKIVCKIKQRESQIRPRQETD